MHTFTDRGCYLASAVSAEGVLTTYIDMRATNGSFLRWFSGSGNGPSAGASAIFQIEHSHDMTAWTIVEKVTGSAGEVGTAHQAKGCYGYLRANMVEVYSAAETGTGSLWVFVRPGVK